MKIAVIALGGNSLITPKENGTIEQQIKHLNKTISNLKNISKKYKLVIIHGNGPQIGNLLLQQETGKVPQMPLDVCDAMTQGQLGYIIQKSIQNILNKKAVTIITQVLVDKKDAAFKNPTKPIGPYYKTRTERNMIKEPEGWRKVVHSPKPKQIIEIEQIKSLAKDFIVISCGGGGIPVIRENKLKGIEAVIDKDYVTGLLATELNADLMIFLTDVDYVYLNYESEKPIPILEMNVKEAKRLMRHFKEGSMKPKIQSSINFLNKGGRKVIITKPEFLEEALKGRKGTTISKV